MAYYKEDAATMGMMGVVR